MSGNRFGRVFCVTTFGESHGTAIGCVIDGCPPQLLIDEAAIQADLDRRRPGTSKNVTQRKEPDRVEILSGVFEGKTTGTPIALLIRNEDAKSKDYSKIASLYRPGHADYTYDKKYGIRDYRGGGRSSARETAARVGAGAIAKQILKNVGIRIQARLAQMDDIIIADTDWDETNNNPFFASDATAVAQLENRITELRRQGDSCGALIETRVTGVPAGWGNPVFDRLDADIAKALMGINAVKGVEIGAGFKAVAMHGSEHNDTINKKGFTSNHAGGILGGISSGQTITANLVVKPTSSITQPQATINTDGDETQISTSGRHDPCVGIRAVPIVEAMMALVLVDSYMLHRAQCG